MFGFDDTRSPGGFLNRSPDQAPSGKRGSKAEKTNDEKRQQTLVQQCRCSIVGSDRCAYPRGVCIPSGNVSFSVHSDAPQVERGCRDNKGRTLKSHANANSSHCRSQNQSSFGSRNKVRLGRIHCVQRLFGCRIHRRGAQRQNAAKDHESEQFHILSERIVYDSSLILGFTTGRILLVSEGRLSKAGGFAVLCHRQTYTRVRQGSKHSLPTGAVSGEALRRRAGGSL
jgi:hypothetical protein